MGSHRQLLQVHLMMSALGNRQALQEQMDSHRQLLQEYRYSHSRSDSAERKTVWTLQLIPQNSGAKRLEPSWAFSTSCSLSIAVPDGIAMAIVAAAVSMSDPSERRGSAIRRGKQGQACRLASIWRRQTVADL